MRLAARYLLAALTLLAATSASATTIGVSVSGGDTFSNTGTWTLGYSFLVNSSITVVSLGVYDDQQDGLNVSHDVGMWDSAGNLLASTTVGSGTAGTLAGGFRFIPITPLSLTAGNTYYVGSVNGIDNDGWLQDPLIIAAPEITYLSRRFESSGGGLVFPDLAGSGQVGYFGGNFEFGSAVPEPTTLALFGAGLLAGARRLRCRRR